MHKAKTDKPKDTTNTEVKKKKFKLGKLVIFITLGLFLAITGYISYRFYMFKPYRVTVSNISSRSATISWVTSRFEPGMVLFKEEKIELPIWVSQHGMRKGYDDRDYTNTELENATKDTENVVSELVVTKQGSYWTHHVTIRDLEPEKQYAFLVGDGFVFKRIKLAPTQSNTLITEKELEEIDTPIPAYGIVQYFDKEEEVYYRLTDGLVHAVLLEEFSGTESKPLSSVFNMDGGWYLDLSNPKTTEGQDFFKSFNEQEATNLYLELTIEGAGFGRWSKRLNYLSVAPSETIIIGEGEDTNADFEGYFYDSEDIRSSLVEKTYAQMWKIGSNVSSLSSGVSATTSLQKEKTNAANDYINASMQAKNWGEAAQDSSHPQNSQAETIVQNANIVKDKSKEIIEITNTTGTSASVLQSQIDTIKNSATLKSAKKAITTTKSPGTSTLVTGTKTTTGTIPTTTTTTTGDPRGTCLHDECSDGGQCGWVDKGVCGCSCSSGRIPLEPGQFCSCDSTGKPVPKGNRIDTLTETVASPKTEICPNNDNSVHTLKTNSSGQKEGVCYSSGGDCWYGLGYITQLGPHRGVQCYDNNTDGQWGDPKFEGRDIPEPEPEPTPEGDFTPETVCCYIDNSFLKDKHTAFECLSKGGIVQPAAECGGSVEPTIHSSCYELSPTISSGHLVTLMGDEIYKCVNGGWRKTVPNPQAVSNFKPNGSCFKPWETTFFNGVRYECNIGGGAGNSYTWQLGSGVNTVAINVDTKPGNTSCTGTCLCKRIEKNIITVWTAGTPSDVEVSSEVEYFIYTGEKCSDSGGYSASTNYKDNKVFASETNTKYIIDTDTGMVSGLREGIYSFERDDQVYMFKVTQENLKEGNGAVRVYIDLNNNGDYDTEDISVSDDASILNLQPVVEGFTYNLKKGYNFVSFPFISDDIEIIMGSDLLEKVNYNYNNVVYSISKFDSGKWVIVGANAGNYDQNDFQIIPGEGYVLKAKWDVQVTLYGNEITYESTSDSAPVRFMPGWNLVGLYGTGTKSYTAESLLEDITNYEPVDFTAVNVSRWQENRALYEALQRDEDSTVYGLDFPIELKRGYFVRVTQGEGNWQPAIQ